MAGTGEESGRSGAGYERQGPAGAAKLNAHYANVSRGLRRGRVTPVIGAGVNLCGRSEANEVKTWEKPFPPSAKELTSFLAHTFELPLSERADLLRASQYIYEINGGEGPLFEELHELFVGEYAPNPVHTFLAEVPALLRAREIPIRSPRLIVTTNYDDLMERALRAHGVEFDLIVYMASGPHTGRFCHQPPDGTLVPLEPQDFTRTDGSGPPIDPEQRTVVLKLHGFADRSDRERDSYVITEDHYIEYLTRLDLNSLLPPTVLGVLRNSHLLFLGYGLRDWNVRAMLHKLWTERLRDNDWWAVQLTADELEERSWQRRGVEIFTLELGTYVEGLRERFTRLLNESQ